MRARGVCIVLKDASSCKVSKLIACPVTIRCWAPLGMALCVVLGPRRGWMRVGVGGRWRCRGVVTGMIGIGSILLAALYTPGVLLHVTRRCRRGVERKLRLAVGFLVSRMGGAFVIRGNVMMGAVSITLCCS